MTYGSWYIDVQFAGTNIRIIVGCFSFIHATIFFDLCTLQQSSNQIRFESLCMFNRSITCFMSGCKIVSTNSWQVDMLDQWFLEHVSCHLAPSHCRRHVFRGGKFLSVRPVNTTWKGNRLLFVEKDTETVIYLLSSIPCTSTCFDHLFVQVRAPLVGTIMSVWSILTNISVGMK